MSVSQNLVWPHYQTHKITSMDDIRQLFDRGVAADLNWLFVDTGGVGSAGYSLERAEAHIRGEFTAEEIADAARFGEDLEERRHPTISVLALRPRLVALAWGEIPVTLDDIAFLRQLAEQTAAVIAELQGVRCPG